MPDGPAQRPSLERAIGLPMLILYGLGVTIGAGIYVLIGVTAGRAGIYAPISFVVAAVVMLFSATSFAEMAGRFPVSAGEATYVRAGFGWEWMALAVGLVVTIEATIAGATISLGSVGYIRQFVDLPPEVLVAGVIILMGMIAALGTLQSIGFAAVMTVIEVGALLAIIGGGLWGRNNVASRLIEVVPFSLDLTVSAGIFSASLLAFFAFIGFEDMINVAEETKRPERTIPVAICATLGIVTVLYFLVTSVAVLSVPPGALAASDAPLGLVFSAVTTMPTWMISIVAIVATLNGVIIQIILASRVLYGLSSQGSLPAVFSQISPVTRTPLISTSLITALVLAIALLWNLENLAEFSSQITLGVLFLVNVALVRLKMRNKQLPQVYFSVPIWMPILGALLAAALLVSGFL